MVTSCLPTKTVNKKGAVMGRIVQIKKNGKVKKAEGAAIRTLQEYGALNSNAKSGSSPADDPVSIDACAGDD